MRYVVENPRRASTAAADSLTCHPAGPHDVGLLARMNRQLIEDEASRNPMSLSELGNRMKSWLDGNWQAVVVDQGGEPVGYMLFQMRSDEYRTADKTVYVGQFFIARDYRCRGFGRRAFDLVAETCFPDAASITLDVLETNPRARRFWESLGFRAYCTTLKQEPEADDEDPAG